MLAAVSSVRPWAGAHAGGCCEIAGAGQRADVVQDGIERWPELDPHQAHHEALDGHGQAATLGQQEQQEDEGEDGVDHRLDHVAHHGQRLGGDAAHRQKGCVGGCGGVGAGGGEHGRRGVVELEPGQAVGVLHQVDHDVLAQQVGGALGRDGDLGLGVGLLDLAIDHARRQRWVHRGVELEREQGAGSGDFRWQSVGELGVDVGAGVDLDRCAPGREACRVGVAHQRPDVGALGEGSGIDGAVLQVIDGAVVDVGDQVGAQLRVPDGGRTRGLDQPVAEHHAVLLVRQLGRQLRVGVRDHLEGRLEEPGHDVANPAGVVAEEGHTDRHVAHRHRRLAAQLVDHHHIDLGQEHGVVDQHEADEPTPACEPPRREEPCESGHQHAGDRHRLDQTEIVRAAHDGGDCVEDPGQGVDIAVGIDLEHPCSAGAGCQEPRGPALALKSSIAFTAGGMALQSWRSRVCRSWVIDDTERTLA
jgi:hypothetical protein